MPKHLENEYEVLNLAEFLAYIDEYKLGKIKVFDETFTKKFQVCDLLGSMRRVLDREV